MIRHATLKQIRQIEIRTNRGLILSLALVLGLALTGCAAAKKPLVVVPGPDRAGVQLPVKLRNYHEAYAFIANLEGFPTDDEALLEFAADSTTEILPVGGPFDYVRVVVPGYYDGGIDNKLRGAQGNGGIYVLRLLARDYRDTDRGFELIGVAAGNTWRFSTSNNIPLLTTTWHMSATESPQSIYRWNGRFFEELK